MTKLIQLIIALALSNIALSQDYWVQRDSLNGPPRSVCAAFVIGEDGYVAGGLDEGSFKRSMVSFDPWQNDWDDESSIGGPNGDGLDRGSASAFSIGNKGYICLGQGDSNPFFGDCWEYDATTGAWSQKADFIGTERRQAVGFSVGGYGYVGTGIDINGFTNDFYRFDPLTNSWSQVASFGGSPRKEAVGFRMGAKGYVGTGDDGTYKNDFWEYNPETDTWTQKASFPGTPRKGAVGWGTFPTCFIATGEDNNFDYKKDVYEYNFYLDAWVSRQDFIGPGRTNAIAFVIDGVAFVGSGYNGQFLDDFYGYQGIASVKETEQVDIAVSPNPMTDQMVIQAPSGVNIESVTIYNSTGQKVKMTTVGLNSNSIQIHRSNLAAGSYFAKIQLTSSQISTVKFIIN